MAIMEVAESRSIPVIFDESTTGAGRVGVLSCHEILQRKPDIAIFSKLLTGGMVPLSVTLTSEEVYEAFSEDEVQQKLLNGNTFVAGPVACVGALQALSAYNACLKNENHDAKASGPRLLFDEEQCKRLSELACVEQSFTLGTVLTVTIRSESGDRDAMLSHAELIVRRLLMMREGILAGHIGDVVYIMTSPLTKRGEVPSAKQTSLTIAQRSDPTAPGDEHGVAIGQVCA